MNYKVYKFVLGCSCSNAKRTKHRVSAKWAHIMSLSTNKAVKWAVEPLIVGTKKLNYAFIYKIVDWIQ